MSFLARLVCCAFMASVVLYKSCMSKYLLVELDVESLEKKPCTDDLAMGYPDSEEEGSPDPKGKRRRPDPKEKGDTPASKGIQRKFKVPTGPADCTEKNHCFIRKKEDEPGSVAGRNFPFRGHVCYRVGGMYAYPACKIYHGYIYTYHSCYYYYAPNYYC